MSRKGFEIISFHTAQKLAQKLLQKYDKTGAFDIKCENMFIRYDFFQRNSFNPVKKCSFRPVL